MMVFAGSRSLRKYVCDGPLAPPAKIELSLLWEPYETFLRCGGVAGKVLVRELSRW
jgi:hypothetical protein